MPEFSPTVLNTLETLWGYYGDAVYLSSFSSGDKILVSFNIGNVKGIWVLDVGSGNLFKISDSGEHANVVPGSNKILFHDNGIWIMELDGSEKHQILDTGWNPTPSPSGGKFVFWTYQHEVAISDTSGDSVEVIIEGNPGSWSSDESKIFYTYRRAIREVDISTHNSKIIEDSEYGVPVISPDGKKIIFAHGLNYGDIWMLNIETDAIQKILERNKY